MNPNRPIAEKILKDKELSGPEEFVSQVYAVTGDPRLIARTVPLSERSLIALQLLLNILSTTGKPALPKVRVKIPKEKPPKDTEAPPPKEETVPDFYAVLGLSSTATNEEIKKAHRELIKKYHPDVFAGQGLSKVEMSEVNSYAQEINLAYLTLSKDKNRREYDELRKRYSTTPPLLPPPPVDVGKTPKERVAVSGVDAAVAKKGIKVGLKKAGKWVVKQGGKLAAKLGLAEGLSDAAAALTAATGPFAVILGPIVKAVTFIATWIAEKVISKVVDFVRRHKGEVAIGAIFLLTGGVLIGSPALIFSGLGLGAISAGVGGFQALGTGAAQLGQAALTGLTTIALPAIGIPVLVALIAVPAIVVIILVIVNSGAYLVPPASFSVLEENPYIGVVKEVAPPGPFANGDLPLTVTYTITVSAKRGTLTNITFAHKCEVIRQGTTDTCPAPLPSPTPSIISPVEPFVYTYTQTYSGSRYRDSLVINTFTVTADTPEVQQTTASGATSIIIGTPPTACYVVTGNWPDAERVMILSAASNLVGNHPRFVQRLCAVQSQVNLVYDPSRVCGAWACAPIGGNTIYFNSGGLGNLRDATYILAHESGHVLAYGAPQFYAAYLAFPGTLSELPVCTYGGTDPNEGFAEAIAKYAINDSCMANEPNNYQFVDTQIFR